MSVTLERLRALQRQAGATNDAYSGARIAQEPPAPRAGPGSTSRPGNPGPAAPVELPSTPSASQRLRQQLARRALQTTRITDLAPAGAASAGLRAVPAVPGAAGRTLPGIEIDDGLHLIERVFAFPAPSEPLPLAFARREEAVAPRQWLFFDTETTGLAGGTGTRAFMLGAADFVAPGRLRVRQLLIAHLSAEARMLRTFASWLQSDTVLASYNGRSYDAPLLRTRYRLARLPDALGTLDHVDLLHPTRRRYRGRWANCRLATVERELLAIVREDDLPGAQAPMAWLDYLRGGTSALLHRVAEHNRQDVVTLAHLLLRLVQAQGEQAQAEQAEGAC